MNENNKTVEKKNDTLAFIIGGLFILGLVFATYNYFNETEKLDSSEDGSGTISLEKLKETLSTRTSTEDEGEETTTEATNEEKTPATGTLEVAETAKTEWVANQYKEGDLKTGSYTVQYGDTLWEIAEAVYGNGALWTNILSANSSSIGFLPNGQQALIQAGQTITIPAL